MKTDFMDPKDIVILVDESKNLVLFPTGKGPKLEDDIYNTQEFSYGVSYHPIELPFPYDLSELADKIKEAIEAVDQYPMYHRFDGKDTFEEKYYGIKGFKAAVKGKRHISLGWNHMFGKTVSLMLPLKRGYGYIGVERIELDEEADWMDFAKAVYKLVNVTLEDTESFKTFKKNINL